MTTTFGVDEAESPVKRPQQHVMEDRSEILLASLLPDEWIFRRLPKDYGVDIEIELVDQGTVTGNRIWVQLKSTNTVDRRTASFEVGTKFPELAPNGQLEAGYIAYSVSTKELDYALRCSFPLLLFVVDLDEGEIYWLPLRDEVVGSMSQSNPNWRQQQTATVRIPVWNNLASEKESNYSGLRWYAMEPARMYAFATLHYYHHEFQYTGRLSGYEIGDGWIDHGEEVELRQSLQLAQMYVEAALELDVLFGDNGIEFFRLDRIPGVNAFGIGLQLKDALVAASRAVERLDSNTYSFEEMSILLGKVSHAMNLLSTAIASYQGFKTKFLLAEGNVVWRAAAKLHGLASVPTVPLARQLSGFSAGK